MVSLSKVISEKIKDKQGDITEDEVRCWCRLFKNISFGVFIINFVAAFI